jgi:hypothetical protein
MVKSCDITRGASGSVTGQAHTFFTHLLLPPTSRRGRMTVRGARGYKGPQRGTPEERETLRKTQKKDWSGGTHVRARGGEAQARQDGSQARGGTGVWMVILYILAAQQFSTGLGLRASCQHAAEKALGGGRSRDYIPPPFAFPIHAYAPAPTLSVI